MIPKILPLLLLAALAAATSSNDFLQFDKDVSRQLQLSTETETQLGIKLRKAPIRGTKVWVYYEATRTFFQTSNNLQPQQKPAGIEVPQAQFSNCVLEFTSENWNNYQKLAISPQPYCTAAAENRPLPLTFKLFSDTIAGHPSIDQSMNITTVRGSGAAGVCQIVGDPQYRTFDQKGQYLKFQGNGMFTLVESPKLSIQAIQGWCGIGATCVHGLAIRYGGTVVRISNLDDREKAVTTEAMSAKDTVEVSGRGRDYMVTLGDGSTISLQGRKWVYRFFNVDMRLAEYHKGKVAGLCGKWDGEASNDYTAKDGKTVYSLKSVNHNGRKTEEFAETWRVPSNPKENLFQCKGNECLASAQKVQVQGPAGILCRIPSLSPADQQRLAEAAKNPAVLPNIAESQIPGVNATNQNGTTLLKTKDTVETTITKLKITLPAPLLGSRTPPGFEFIQMSTKRVSEKFEVYVPPKPVKQQEPPAAQLEQEKKKAMAQCAEKIRLIPGCEKYDDLQERIRNCEYGISVGMPPVEAFETHGDMYRNTCLFAVTSAASEPNQQVATVARETAKKACLGTSQCDSQCAVCTVTGCQVCKDQEKYEVIGNRCQPRIPFKFNVTYFPPPPAPKLLVFAAAPQPQLPKFNVLAIDELVSAPQQIARPPRVVVQYYFGQNAKYAEQARVKYYGTAGIQSPAHDPQQPQQPQQQAAVPSQNATAPSTTGSGTPSRGGGGAGPSGARAPSTARSAPGYGTASPAASDASAAPALGGPRPPRRACVPRHKNATATSGLPTGGTATTSGLPAGGTAYTVGDSGKISSYDAYALASSAAGRAHSVGSSFVAPILAAAVAVVFM